MHETLDFRRNEFREFVWDHAVDEFQAKFDTRYLLNNEEVTFLAGLLTEGNLASAKSMSQAVAQAIGRSPQRAELLLQLVGLTRNKILQDLKGYARSRSLDLSLSSMRALFNTSKGAQLGSEYLSRQIIRVFGPVRGKVDRAVLEAISQATWPGYIRQERAKRMGHEAEHRIARLLKDCGIPFEPAGKALNPLCPDVQIGEISYDLVSPSLDRPLIRVKATVHTANIGQYGESKDDLEMREARAAINKEAICGEVVLLAFIDGVGFESNRAGLDGVLTHADEFCQFRTIWKAAAVAAVKCGRQCAVMLSAKQVVHFTPFCKRYGVKVDLLSDGIISPKGWLAAGDGFVRV